MRYLDGSSVRAALPMEAAIEAMRSAFGDDREVPPRILLGRSLFMPGRVGVETGVKVVSTVPGDPVGLVAAFDGDGRPLGVVDGPTLTAIRTGAGCGLATALLASPQASALAMLGAGAMAFDQVAAVVAVRPIRTVRVWSRSRRRADALAARVAEELAVAAEGVDRADDAVSGADIVSCATPATAPLFSADALGAHVHVNAVGAFRPDMVEVPPEVVRSSFVVVDDRSAAAREAGDLIHAAVEPDAEVADLLAGRVTPPAGRRTLFKSVGIASQDVAAAVVALRRASALGIGSVWEAEAP